MDRPPSVPLRKVESAASSLSSFDINIPPDGHNGNSIPFYDPQSRRLVDYFVVFTSKPSFKNNNKKKKNINADDENDNSKNDGDDNDDNSDEFHLPKGQKTPYSRTFCYTKKQSQPENTISTAPMTIKTISTTKEKKCNKRTTSNLLDDYDNDETPISSHRKSLNTKSKDSTNYLDNYSTGEEKEGEDNDLSIPVASVSKSGSFASESSSNDESYILTDDEDMITQKTKEMNLENENFIEQKDKYKDDDNCCNVKKEKDGKMDEEPLTPSRMRAAQGIIDDDDDDDDIDLVANNNDDMNNEFRNSGDDLEINKVKQGSESNKHSSSQDNIRGASENIHVTGENIGDNYIIDGITDNNDDIINENEAKKEKQRSKPRKTTNDRSNNDRGASENIHLPGQGDNADNGYESNNNLYLSPKETARYPTQEHHDCPFNPMISHFCFPHGQKIQLTTEYIMPRIHYFVLTNDRGKKMYGTCLTVYEEFDLNENPDIDEEDLRPFYRNDDVCVETTDDSESSIEVSLDYAEKCPQLYHPKVICICSSWPYLHAFREYLSQLYRLATMTNMMSCPIERYVLNICEEVPAPPPGIFEIRLQILNSTIRFWAPPANQPIPYVSIPFNALFECLDINNVLFVWYALTLEHKVLLVSSQNSLLALCAEILSALLFPMEWSHLYIPVLPQFLTSMLDAPFPYLCGVSRDNYNIAINDISEETIVVDLDQNLITKGKCTPAFPAMPLRRRSKLEACLQKHVGDVFWSARGVTKEEVENFEDWKNSSSSKRNGDMNKTLRIWKEKLISYDDAFNLAFTPNSENVLNGEKSLLSGDECVQTKWDCVQEGFFSFFTAMLRDYKRFISKGTNGVTFREREFLNSQRPDFRPYLKEFIITQQFDCFITKRMKNNNDADVLFFDQSIQAKRNRSKMVIKKKRTPFLQSAKAQKQLRTVEAAKPSVESESTFNFLERFYVSASDDKTFSYSRWPEAFDPNLLKNPRKIPDVIAAEFDRLAATRTNQRDIDTSDFIVTDIDYSVELTTFTIFFTLCCQFIGKELAVIQNQYLPQGTDAMLGKDNVTRGGFHDCANICTLGLSVKSSTVDAEYTASYKDYAVESLKNDQLSDFANELLESEIETARVFAFAELDLAFSAMETLFIRKMKPSVDALKALMTACGRCGSSQRATKLMTMIQDQGVHIDSETYFYFVMNAPLDEFDKSHRYHGWNAIRWRKSGRKKHRRKQRGDDCYVDNSDNSSSYSGNGSSFQDTMSLSSSNAGHAKHLPPRPLPPVKRRKPILTKDKLGTTAQIDKHINIGESLLNYLYSDLEIDISPSCRSCGTILSADQVRYGWKCSFTDYTTECMHCQNNFVPSFVVKCSNQNFCGSSGLGTPLFCEFFSPWVLLKELHSITQGGQEDIMDPKWRNDGGMNATIWWNLVVSFQRHKLPITFLLQGSFRERLIMPMPE